mgnify:CR=1 FL=1
MHARRHGGAGRSAASAPGTLAGAGNGQAGAGEAGLAPATQVNPQLAIPVPSGNYRCELNARVDIKTDSRDANRIDVGWKGQRYSLVRYDSFSGLPRFEDKSSRLVWVVLPWKGLLLDGRSGQPLANECKLG